MLFQHFFFSFYVQPVQTICTEKEDLQYSLLEYSEHLCKSFILAYIQVEVIQVRYTVCKQTEKLVLA